MNRDPGVNLQVQGFGGVTFNGVLYFVWCRKVYIVNRKIASRIKWLEGFLCRVQPRLPRKHPHRTAGMTLTPKPEPQGSKGPNTQVIGFRIVVIKVIFGRVYDYYVLGPLG